MSPWLDLLLQTRAVVRAGSLSYVSSLGVKFLKQLTRGATMRPALHGARTPTLAAFTQPQVDRSSLQ